MSEIDYESYKERKNYGFLKPFIGKIFVVKAINIGGKKTFPKGYNKEQKYKFNGIISNQDIRQKLPYEIIIEFDHKKGVSFDEAKIESEFWIAQLEVVLKEQGVYYVKTEHNGKSPHIRFILKGLEKNPPHIIAEHNKELLKGLIPNFNPVLVDVDVGLLCSIKKGVSLEEQPHYKEDYNHAIEKYTYINEEGRIPIVSQSRIDKIISKLSKKDIGLSNLKGTPSDIHIEKFKSWFLQYFKAPNRHNVILSSGGVFRRLNFSFDDLMNVISQCILELPPERLDFRDTNEFITEQKNKLEYAYKLDSDKVAVKYFLDLSDDLKDAYSKLLACFDMDKIKIRYFEEKIANIPNEHKLSDLLGLSDEIKKANLSEGVILGLIEDLSIKTGRGKTTIKKLFIEENNVSTKHKKLEAIKKTVVETYLDEFKTPCVTIKTSNGKESMLTSSKTFDVHIIKTIFDAFNESISESERKTIIGYFEAQAYNDNKEHQNFIRCGFYDETYYIDTCNPNKDIIKINQNTIEVVKDAPIRFLRYPHMRELKIDMDANISDFYLIEQFARIKDENDRLAFLCYVVVLIDAEIPIPINEIWGSEGAAKSSTQKSVKNLIDPSIMEALDLPSKLTDYNRQLSRNFIIIFDNLKHLPDKLSNAFCRTVYGEYSEERKLYSNNDGVYYGFKRAIMLNGINTIISNPDATDRALRTEGSRIPDDEFISVKKLKKKFTKVQPIISGALIKLFQKSLAYRETIESEIDSKKLKSPRLKDFFISAEAVSRAMGNENNKFTNAFIEIIKRAKKESLNYDALGEVFLKFVDNLEYFKYESIEQYLNQIGLNNLYQQNEFKVYNKTVNTVIKENNFIISKFHITTAEELYQNLEIFNENKRNDKFYPTNSIHLVRRLNKLKDVLREQNIYLQNTLYFQKKKFIVFTVLSLQSQSNQQNGKNKITDLSNKFGNVYVDF